MLNLKGPSLGISGRFKIDVLNSKGELVEDKCLPEQKNLVTEAGLAQILKGEASPYLVLGTGSTPPQREDIRLDNALVVSPSRATFNGGTLLNETSFQVSRVFTFNLGQVVGNITELGLATPYSSLSSYTLLTRALIKDALGNATSIEILADEQLKITYTLKIELSDNVDPYTINVESDGNFTEHTITPLFKIHNTQVQIFQTNRSGTFLMHVNYANGTSSDSGDSVTKHAGAFSVDRNTYSENWTGYAGISKWNGNIAFIGIADAMRRTDNFGATASFHLDSSRKESTSGTAFVWRIDPPIIKTNQQIMEISCSISVTYGD